MNADNIDFLIHRFNSKKQSALDRNNSLTKSQKRKEITLAMLAPDLLETDPRVSDRIIVRSCVVRVFTHGAMGHRIDPSLRYFSFQPVLHDLYTKGQGMCYPVCGMMNIKEPLLLIRKNSPFGSSGFSFSLSEWSFTMSDAI